MRKNKMYEVLYELYKKSMINRSLLYDISDVIEFNHTEKASRKFDEKLELFAILPDEDQVSVMTMMTFR